MSQTSRANVVEIGNRQLTGLAAGTQATDAVNVQQLTTALAGISGGTAPVWLATSDPTVVATQAGFDAVSVGPGAVAGAAGSTYGQNTAVGAGASAGTYIASDGTSGQATAVGAHSSADATGSSVLGQSASVTSGGRFSVALGAFTTTDRSHTVAIGYRSLSQVRDGQLTDDAATVGQVTPFAAYLGGGASFDTGAFSAPTYVLLSPGAAGSYNDVGSALTALDNGLALVNTRIDNLPPPGNGGTGAQGPVGPQGPAGADGKNGLNGKDGKDGGAANGTDKLAVHYDSADQSSVTLQGSNGTQVHNVTNGVADSDAANVGQVNEQVQQALDTAKTYTDASSRQTLNWANNYTDRKIAGLSARIDNAEAMSTAMSQQTATFAGADPGHRNRVAAGVGFAGGHNAVSVGYQHVSATGRMAFNVGGAVSGNDRTVGAGIGYSW
jgi:hypothetical protein